jgi:hypothetical protein
VELSSVGSVITLRINKKPILNYTNTTAFTSGRIMLGYLDAFDSVGTRKATSWCMTTCA